MSSNYIDFFLAYKSISGKNIKKYNQILCFQIFLNLKRFLHIFSTWQSWGIFSKNRDCKNIELAKFVDYMLIEKWEYSKFVCVNFFKNEFL